MRQAESPKTIAQYLVDQRKLSQRAACRQLGLSRSVLRYRPKHPDLDLEAKLRLLASQNPRFGSRRLTQLLRRQGYKVNYKRIARLCRLEGLTLRIKRRRKIIVRGSPKKVVPIKSNIIWSIDFVHDRLSGGGKYRCFTIVDNFSRECPGILVQQKIRSEDVVLFLENLSRQRLLPEYFLTDNGSEFISKIFQRWCENRGIEIIYIEPGQPTQNAFIESFNSRFRDECLNQRQMTHIYYAKEVIERWRVFYNTERPHSSINYMTPNEMICAI